MPPATSRSWPHADGPCCAEGLEWILLETAVRLYLRPPALARGLLVQILLVAGLCGLGKTTLPGPTSLSLLFLCQKVRALHGLSVVTGQGA